MMINFTFDIKWLWCPQNCWIEYYSQSLITEEGETLCHTIQDGIMHIVFYGFVEYEVISILDLCVQWQLCEQGTRVRRNGPACEIRVSSRLSKPWVGKSGGREAHLSWPQIILLTFSANILISHGTQCSHCQMRGCRRLNKASKDVQLLGGCPGSHDQI